MILAMYLLVLVWPIFFLVVLGLLAYGWVARNSKRDKEHRSRIQQIGSARVLKDGQPHRTLGFLAEQTAIKVLSGIVWVAVAIVITVVLILLLNWRFYWGELFGSGNKG